MIVCGDFNSSIIDADRPHYLNESIDAEYCLLDILLLLFWMIKAVQ